MAKKKVVNKTDIEPEVEQSKLDWKLVGIKLKGCVESINSIDNYYRKDYIGQLRERFNSKERTQELFDQIISL